MGFPSATSANWTIPSRPQGSRLDPFYRAWKNKTGKRPFTCVYQLETLRRCSDLRYPGWEMDIPDQVRADAFLQALAEFERAGEMPEFMIVYLPNDHTTGGGRDVPTPRAFVADNDLALGRVLEGLSKSPFWKDLVVFINEDDPQSGADHVDGHRSICLLAGPYVKRGGTVISRFYNQASVLHTICRIFGLPPMNQTVAMAPPWTTAFRTARFHALYLPAGERAPGRDACRAREGEIQDPGRLGPADRATGFLPPRPPRPRHGAVQPLRVGRPSTATSPFRRNTAGRTAKGCRPWGRNWTRRGRRRSIMGRMGRMGLIAPMSPSHESHKPSPLDRRPRRLGAPA